MKIQQTEIESKIVCGIVNEPEAHGYIFSELTPEHFTEKEARTIFVIASKMNLKGEPVEYATLQPRLDEKTDKYLMDAVIGKHFLASAAQVPYYVQVLKRLYACRETAKAARDAITQLETGEDSAIYELATKIDAILDIEGGDRLTPISDAVTTALHDLGTVQDKALLTGFKAFDKYFRGVAPGRLVLLAAETAAGKSAFALNIALNVAKHGGVVLYVSLEMTESEIAQRLIANHGGIRMDRLQRMAAENDQEAIDEAFKAGNEIKDLDLILSCKPSSAQQITALIKQVKAAYGRCDLVIVDYLQLVTTGRRTETREREVADISRTLAATALQEKTCIIALSQVNRQVNMRDTRELMLSDIRESAAPTHDAAGVFLLYPATDDDEDVLQYKLKIAKNRNGQTGVSSIIFEKSKQRFTDAAPRS